MANEIKIIIGGDAGDLVRAAKESEGAINRLGNVAQQAERSFAQIGPSMDRAAQSAHRLKEGFKDPSGANLFTGLAQGAKSILRPIEELEAELQDLQAAMRRTTDPRLLKAYGDQIERIKLQIGNIRVVGFQNSLEKINQSATQAAAGLRRIQPGANEATFALTNLSRIAQDAPFGFIGIANNINPLLESFQRLKAQTGTTKTAFSALISSLSGAGGLGLAVGIGTAALSLLGQGFFSGGRAAKKAKEEVSEFGKIVEEAASGVGRDAARVTTLFNALTSGTLNVEQRKSALKELQSINKEFFGSLKEEKGIIDGLQQAYDNYLAKIVQIGKAKAIESQLTKLFNKKLELELSIDPKFNAQVDPSTQRVIASLRKELNKLGGAVDITDSKFNSFDKSVQERVRLQQQIFKLEQGIQFLPDAGVRQTQREIENIDLQIKGLSELQQLNAEFNIQTDKAGKKEEDALKKRLAALEKIRDLTSDIKTQTDLSEQILDLKTQITIRDAKENNLSKEEVDLAIKGFQKEFQDALDKETLSFESIIKVKATRVELAELSQSELDALANGTKVRGPLSGIANSLKEIKIDARSLRIKLLGLPVVEAEDFVKSAAKQLRDTILSSLTGAIGDSANVIGELFAGIISGDGIGSALARAAQGFLSIIGTVLQDIGKQIIATSVAVQALKKALASLFTNPILAIGAGLGLIALGGVLKNMKFNLPKFQDGGITSGPSSGFPAILHPNEAIIPLDKLPDIVGRLKANDLNLTLLPSIRFSGSDFQIMLERVQNKRDRLG